MEKLRTRSQIEKTLKKLGYPGLDFEFDRETILYPAKIVFYSAESNPVGQITQPTILKLKTLLEELKEQGVI